MSARTREEAAHWYVVVCVRHASICRLPHRCPCRMSDGEWGWLPMLGGSRQSGHHKPEIHGVDPEFESTLRLLYMDFQSNCWVNLRIFGQPCEFYLTCGLCTWQFVNAKAGDGSLAAAWFWGMAVHPPATRLWPSQSAAGVRCMGNVVSWFSSQLYKNKNRQHLKIGYLDVSRRQLQSVLKVRA
jgi:hypothetical protein